MQECREAVARWLTGELYHLEGNIEWRDYLERADSLLQAIDRAERGIARLRRMADGRWLVNMPNGERSLHPSRADAELTIASVRPRVAVPMPETWDNP